MTWQSSVGQLRDANGPLQQETHTKIQLLLQKPLAEALQCSQRQELFLFVDRFVFQQ